MKKIILTLSILFIVSFTALAEDALFDKVDGVELSEHQMNDVKGDGWISQIAKKIRIISRGIINRRTPGHSPYRCFCRVRVRENVTGYPRKTLPDDIYRKLQRMIPDMLNKKTYSSIYK